MPAGESSRTAVADHLKRLRGVLGWTLDDLAGRAREEGLAISTSTLSRLERGKTALPFETVVVLARCLGTPLGHLEDAVRASRGRHAVHVDGADFDALIAEGNSLARSGAIERALDHFEAAHDWLASRPDLAGREEMLAKTLIYLAEGHRRLRRFEVAQARAAEVLNLPGCSLDNRLRAVLIHASIARNRGHAYKARLYARHAEELLPQAGPAAQAYAHGVLGFTRLELGELDAAVRLLESARARYTELGNELEACRMAVQLGFCHHRLGHPAAGWSMVRQGYEAARGAGWYECATSALLRMGEMARADGRPEVAVEHFELAAAIAARHSYPLQGFLAWHGIWQIARAGADAEAEARVARVLRRLLRKLAPDFPEAREFLDAGCARPEEGRRP